MNNKATILITALWMVAILTIFAVTAGKQSAISLKLTSYNVDRLKAYFIARAAILRALAEKNLEYKSGRSTAIDALSQKWANNEELFKKHKFGDGDYTLGYEYAQETAEDEKPLKLYGLMDEQSKININTAPKETLANLIASFEVDRDDAEEIAAAIVDWRDEDDEATTAEEGSFYGAESDYYEGLSPSYSCKDLPFDTIYELTLVKGVTPEVLSRIRPYITVYGDGKVNINTASEVVLNALFGGDFENLASKIARYRQGNDDIIGTRDDRWFALSSYVVDREEEGLVEIKNLQEAEWYANIYGIGTEEYNRIRELISGGDPQLCVNSKTYRAIASGEVKRVRVRIKAVYQFEDSDKPPVVKFWHEE